MVVVIIVITKPHGNSLSLKQGLQMLVLVPALLSRLGLSFETDKKNFKCCDLYFPPFVIWKNF